MSGHIISSIPLFSKLPSSEIEYLAKTLHPCELPAERLLFQEGVSDERFYILLDGQVEIIKALGTDAERLIAVREESALLGEMSLFTQNGHHTASVRARTPVKLLEMTREDFDALLHRQPTLAYEIVRLLSSRLEESENLTILDLKEKNRQLVQAYEELKAAQEQIIEKERLERELEIARQIQLSILPQKLPKPAHFDLGALMYPARAVGGDFFDFMPLGRNRLAIVVGDVSDKGVPAALFMALTYSLIRAEARRRVSPGEVLLAVNRHLLAMDVSDMFVTVLFGLLDCRTGDFDYVRAGHTYPLFLDERGQPLKLERGPGQVLGFFEHPQLDEQHVTLANGNIGLLYSDGLSEASNSEGEEFGMERLLGALSPLRDGPAQAICERLWEAVSEFSAPLGQQDDFTLVCIKGVK